MAEALNSLVKAELIRDLGPWKGIEVENNVYSKLPAITVMGRV